MHRAKHFLKIARLIIMSCICLRTAHRESKQHCPGFRLGRVCTQPAARHREPRGHPSARHSGIAGPLPRLAMLTLLTTPPPTFFFLFPKPGVRASLPPPTCFSNLPMNAQLRLKPANRDAASPGNLNRAGRQHEAQSLRAEAHWTFRGPLTPPPASPAPPFLEA